MKEITAKYLSLKELSRHSSLSVRTLRAFLTDPQDPLPHYRLPRKILVDKYEFDNWLKAYRIVKAVPDLDALVSQILREISCDPECNLAHTEGLDGSYGER
jgi:hypothetical protein